MPAARGYVELIVWMSLEIRCSTATTGVYVRSDVVKEML